ncbi:ribosomal protein L49/IMG2 [Radiomyces spectabilis]|uniref:ribosomal protein L49/IMG2 n=1 Tax=Radiomyces spectabilis TaxID=64574 RepID=UPI00221F5232|nr:ribosomal protein L49/IMG2 [Radiomyces spectabilis]KAI8381332.1 ribosomal protein L49/IMG2 [Radiomyces spectabilis]
MFRSWIQVCGRRLYSTEATPSYFVSRTANKGLPVYSEFKNGGTQQLTIIRRIEGNAEALKNEILPLFPDAPKDHIRINPTNNHIIIKGVYVNEIKEWLVNKGF